MAKRNRRHRRRRNKQAILEPAEGGSSGAMSSAQGNRVGADERGHSIGENDRAVLGVSKVDRS